jgi:hypothetical protein
MFGHDMVVVADDGPRADVRGLPQLVTERDGELTVVRFAARPGWGGSCMYPLCFSLHCGWQGPADP